LLSRCSLIVYAGLITIWDTGIGIPEEQQELVFEKFHQDRGHIYSRKEEGTGLGLHISKHLAKQMGGDIVLRSEVDKGSEFIVLLPLSI
jgi:signal transduction histidine kinase